MNQECRVPLPLWVRALHGVGSPVTEQCATFRDIVVLFFQTQLRIIRSPCRWSEVCQAIQQIGIGSLPIVVIATGFAGVVVTHEIAWHMDHALHTVTMIPGFTGQFILRELGIAIPALLLVSKVGAAITAEVGTMKITEQIDALRLLGIDPINYLVQPRYIASIFSSACLAVIASGITLGCAVFVAVNRYHFSTLEYINTLRHFVGLKDLVCVVMKGMIYGAVIPIVSCAYGFRCKGGAEGVGTATTNSVVAATIAVIVLDFILTYVFTLIL